MKRKALGKGLSALLPEPESAAGGDLAQAPIDSLDPNPFQPRTNFEPGKLAELAASLQESGMVQPILVRRVGGRYQIIAGERRWRAAQQLGLAQVPVVLREVSDEQLLELALVENIQREELTPIEEAQAYQRLHEEFHLTQEQLAQKVGKDRSTVANTMRLLRLPREVRELLAGGRLGAGHGRALLALESADAQISMAREAARKGSSVREVERRVALERTPRPGRSRRPDPNTRAAEERLRAALGTRVEISRRGPAGALKIAFSNEAELNRLFELLVRAGRGRA